MNYTNLSQNIKIYFKEIKSFDNLSRVDEINLFSRIESGDKSAECEIFNKLSKLAVTIAKTYTNNPDLLEDLIQEANMGILTAIKKYDSAMGYRFSSYAKWWMKGNINMFLSRINIVHPCSPKIIQMSNKIKEQFYRNNHRDITEYELMDRLEEMGEIITDVSGLLNVKVTRIDLPVSESEDLTKGEMGEYAEVTASDNGFLANMDNEELGETVCNLLKKLDDREKTLVSMKFGLSRNYEMDYETIAQEWNENIKRKGLAEGWDEKKIEKECLTSERIRQIIVAALKKMK